MTKLSVNINKVAVVRNSRGGNNPDLIQVAKDCELFGAQGITIHPRPDERHIRYQDAFDLKEVVTTELNIEGNPVDKFNKMVCEVVPDQVTLVPDAPDAITSDAGWDTLKHQDYLMDVISMFKEHGIRTSIFLNPDPKFIESAKSTGADRIELYTEGYAQQYLAGKEQAISAYQETAIEAAKAGLGINAGHDLDLNNLKFFAEHIENLEEVSIGHALVCDALYMGLEETIKSYLNCLRSVEGQKAESRK